MVGESVSRVVVIAFRFDIRIVERQSPGRQRFEIATGTCEDSIIALKSALQRPAILFVLAEVPFARYVRMVARLFQYLSDCDAVPAKKTVIAIMCRLDISLSCWGVGHTTNACLVWM